MFECKHPAGTDDYDFLRFFLGVQTGQNQISVVVVRLFQSDDIL